MQEGMASFGRQTTINKNRADLSIISRSIDPNESLILDLKLHYEDQLEKLRSDLNKERSKNRKYVNFIASRGTNNGIQNAT